MPSASSTDTTGATNNTANKTLKPIIYIVIGIVTVGIITAVVIIVLKKKNHQTTPALQSPEDADNGES